MPDTTKLYIPLMAEDEKIIGRMDVAEFAQRLFAMAADVAGQAQRGVFADQFGRTLALKNGVQTLLSGVQIKGEKKDDKTNEQKN